MDISADMVKVLRDETGISVMQCKRALEEAGGDMEKARVALQAMSAAQAEKKADRTLGAGIIASYIHGNKKMGVLLELSCETDFVAQNEEFVSAANQIAMHAGAMAPETLEELAEQAFIMNPELTIKQVVDGLIQKTGERVEIARFVRYTIEA
jgi:elongation factor Ts